jgi:hypothetical protein
MNAKTLAGLAAGCLLSACSKNPTPTFLPPAPKPALVILVMGQSNAENLVRNNGEADLEKDLGRPVRMINCAAGGTSMLQWQKGQPLYDACIQQVKDIHIDAMWFDQGEYELQNVATIGTGPAAEWSRDFTHMVRDLQNDLGPVPVFFARLGLEMWHNDPNYFTLRDQQTGSSCAEMVSLDGIDSWNPPHYSADGYAQIASRLADALRSKNL